MLSSISRVLLVRRTPAVAVAVRTRNYTSASGYGDIDQTGYGASLDGQSSRATTEAEHPGREPVKEGRGSGSGGHEKTDAEPDGQKQAAASGGGGGGGGGDKKKGGDHHHHRPQPKILDDSQSTQRESEATKQHNREMDQRYDHEKDGKNDKVDKGYWKGERDPLDVELRPKLTVLAGSEGGSVVKN